MQGRAKVKIIATVDIKMFLQIDRYRSNALQRERRYIAAESNKRQGVVKLQRVLTIEDLTRLFVSKRKCQQPRFRNSKPLTCLDKSEISRQHDRSSHSNFLSLNRETLCNLSGHNFQHSHQHDTVDKLLSIEKARIYI